MVLTTIGTKDALSGGNKERSVHKLMGFMCFWSALAHLHLALQTYWPRTLKVHCVILNAHTFCLLSNSMNSSLRSSNCPCGVTHKKTPIIYICTKPWLSLSGKHNSLDQVVNNPSQSTPCFRNMEGRSVIWLASKYHMTSHINNKHL